MGCQACWPIVLFLVSEGGPLSIAGPFCRAWLLPLWEFAIGMVWVCGPGSIWTCGSIILGSLWGPEYSSALSSFPRLPFGDC